MGVSCFAVDLHADAAERGRQLVIDDVGGSERAGGSGEIAAVDAGPRTGRDARRAAGRVGDAAGRDGGRGGEGPGAAYQGNGATAVHPVGDSIVHG